MAAVGCGWQHFHEREIPAFLQGSAEGKMKLLRRDCFSLRLSSTLSFISVLCLSHPIPCVLQQSRQQRLQLPLPPQPAVNFFKPVQTERSVPNFFIGGECSKSLALKVLANDPECSTWETQEGLGILGIRPRACCLGRLLMGSLQILTEQLENKTGSWKGTRTWS